jgi:D-alanine-D-alanine ligase
MLLCRGTGMSLRVAIIYNQPELDRYSAMGEQKAVLGVLVEVKAVHAGLAKLGHTVEQVPIAPPLEAVQRTISQLAADAVFNLFEGFAGRPETEAAVAAMLSSVGIPYTGCSASALSLTLDKSRTKQILRVHGLPTPAFQVLDPETIGRFDLQFPCIVKPAAEDASHGLSERSVVTDAASLEAQVRHISGLYNGQALVEEYIDGREFNVSVIGNDQPVVLPVSEIVYTLPEGMPRILTFEAKWEPGSLYFKSSAPVCPAAIDDIVRQRIEAPALSAYKLLGCTGYARVDFRMGSDSIPQIIEVNANPDLSPGYGIALQSRLAGMSYARLIERIMQLAMERRAVGA